MSNLGKLFLEIRLSKNWSIRQAAKNMGISYSYLSILEKGKDPRTGKDSNPKPEMLRIISKTYDYPYEELMKAAGYLNDDNNYMKEFNLDLFSKNILLVMGKMDVEEFSKDIYKKTGYQIMSDQIRGYLNGDIQPFPGTLNILSKYAQVSTKFWLTSNTEKSLLEDIKMYKNNSSKSSQEVFGKDYLHFSNLPEELRQFTLNKDNHLYLKAAIDAKRKGINPNTLKLLIQTIASELEPYK